MKPELDYAGLLAYLKLRREQVLSEEYLPAYIKQVRCQNQLCRSVSAEEVAERQKAFAKADFKVKQLLIAEQVIRDEFGPAVAEVEE
jgi:hypothetical protein